MVKQNDHKSLAIWAADRAEKVLPYFEKENPKDDRPRKAIEALRAWAKDELACGEVRKAAWAAHAAARSVKTDTAIFAARISGQAASVAHVPTHISGVIYYEEKLSKVVKSLKNKGTK